MRVAPWALRTSTSRVWCCAALLGVMLVSMTASTFLVHVSAQDETPASETQTGQPREDDSGTEFQSGQQVEGWSGSESQTGQQADIPSRGPTPDDIGEPPQSFSSKRVYDMAELLDEREQAKVEGDARRLSRFGIPAIIITQASDMTEEEATTFAADVRREWGVETSFGADNGLVMLVNVGESARRSIFSTMSWGSQALPHAGVDLLLSKQIQSEWLDANLETFDVYEGVLFTLRRLIYLSIYEVGPPPPLSGGLETLHTTLVWLAPLLTVFALLAYAPKWFPQIRQLYPERLASTLEFIRTLAVPVLALDLAVAAVWSRSEVAIVCTAILIAVMVLTWSRTPSSTNGSIGVDTATVRHGGLS